MKPFLVAAALCALVGCEDRGVGRLCVNPAADGGVRGTQLNSPALECPTRLCLLQGDNFTGTLNRSTCSDRCEKDDDCGGAVISKAGGSDALCTSKFVCAVATVTGPFKCQKICICKDDIICGVNGDFAKNPITPPSCPNPTTPQPSCSGS